MSRLWVVAALFFCVSAVAEDVEVLETWRCYTGYWKTDAQLAIKLEVISSSLDGLPPLPEGFVLDPTVGRVYAAGTTSFANYEVDGINRVWHWGKVKASGSRLYSFVIQPDNSGYYYDLSDSVSHTLSTDETKPSQTFECQQDKQGQGK